VKLVEPHENKTTIVIPAADYYRALNLCLFAIPTNISMDSLDNEKFCLDNQFSIQRYYNERI
jgi:hypothetical protein